MHCTLGIVSHNSNSSTLPMSLIIHFDFFAEWIVDVILLQVGMKCISMRMIFDPFTSSRTRRCSASFSTECDSLGTQKSILFLFLIHRDGFPVPFRSFSTCLGVKTQRFLDSCPDTGFPVLVGSVTLSCFS